MIESDLWDEARGDTIRWNGSYRERVGVPRGEFGIDLKIILSQRHN